MTGQTDRRTERGAGLINRAAVIRAARAAAQSSREVEFPLPATGGAALVRRLDLMELIASTRSRPRCRRSSTICSKRSSARGTGIAHRGDARLRRPAGRHPETIQLADALCLAGFIDPRLVATAADVTDPETELVLDEIARADRMAYWNWCQGTTEALALTRRRFRTGRCCCCWTG